MKVESFILFNDSFGQRIGKVNRVVVFTIIPRFVASCIRQISDLPDRLCFLHFSLELLLFRVAIMLLPRCKRRIEIIMVSCADPHITLNLLLICNHINDTWRRHFPSVVLIIKYG